jgi:single-stranded DNA-binding protein
MNSTNLVGRLTKDMEFHEFHQDGKRKWRATGMIAVNREGVRKDAEVQADFIPFQGFITDAQKTGYYEKYFQTGALVSLNDGKIRIDRYKDKEGVNKTAFYVTGNLKFLAASNKSHATNQVNNSPEPIGYEEVSDDDIPF